MILRALVLSGCRSQFCNITLKKQLFAIRCLECLMVGCSCLIPQADGGLLPSPQRLAWPASKTAQIPSKHLLKLWGASKSPERSCTLFHECLPRWGSSGFHSLKLTWRQFEVSLEALDDLSTPPFLHQQKNALLTRLRLKRRWLS